MESVAAERLTKIGKNPSIVSSRADLDEDQRLLNEIVMESTPVVTSASEDEDKDSDDSSGSSKSGKPKKKFKLDFSAKLHKITEERKSRSRENLKDAHLEGKIKNIMRKAPSGPNLFGLLAPPGFTERKRSGSVGANLGMIMEDFAEESSGKKHDDSLGNKFFKMFDMKRKSDSKSSVCDESPTSDGQNMQLLQVPQEKSKSKDPSKLEKRDSLPSKSAIKSETSPSTTSSRKGSEPMQVNFSICEPEDELTPLTVSSDPSEKSGSSKKHSPKTRHVDFEEAHLIPVNAKSSSDEDDKQCESQL